MCNSTNNDYLNSLYIVQYQVKWQMFSHLCPQEHLGLSEHPFSNKCEFESLKPILSWAMTIWAFFGILWLNKGYVVLLFFINLILKHDREEELVIEEDNLFQLWIEDTKNDFL